MTETSRTAALEANLEGVRVRIHQAAARAGRDPSSIKLLAAVKTVPSPLIREGVLLGLDQLGENLVQEAEAHRSELADIDATWHFIGHLQTNKARVAAELFDILQPVDSLRLAQELSRRARRKLRIMIEVNLGREASKFGFAPEEVGSAIASISALPNLNLIGLMTIAPPVDDPEAVRPVFRELKHLAAAHGLAELSMGMSNDFETAIEEGSTLVRIGRALFGERP